ncbi:MAG: class I SAM-dependent methyltransferase [Thermoanaerobaculia bacterium]
MRRYINASLTGDPDQWPMEWFRGAYAETSFERGISFGSGNGALERDVRRKEICKSILGTDISATALRAAQESAANSEINGISYGVMDFNDLHLSNESVDIAFFHQALHHCERLEGCLDQVHRALEPGGILYLDEYVGPSRSDWRQPLLARADAVFRSLPGWVRRRRHLQLPVDWRDPSEAIRSSEILREVRQGFEVLEERGYGGNFLSVIFPHLDLTAGSPADAAEVVGFLIEEEKQVIARGEPPFNVVVIARKHASR